MVISANPEKKQLNLKTITWGDDLGDIVQPTEEATQYLAEHYDFNPLDLDDCLSLRQIPKMENIRNIFLLFFTFRYTIRQRGLAPGSNGRLS